MTALSTKRATALTTPRILLALLRKDARVIYRDPFTLALVCYPLVLAFVLRLVLSLESVASFDANLRVYLAPVVILFGSILFGMVFGLTLIEERENRTWLLLRVLPIEQRAFFAYLLGLSAGLSLPVSLLAALVYGAPVANLPLFIGMLAASAMTAPIIMLSMGVLASNKIEGLVVSKMVSPISLLAALVFVIPPVWQLVIAWNPFYWLYLGLLQAFAGSADASQLAVYWPDLPTWLFVVAPTLLCGVTSAWLARLYRRRAG